MDAKVRVHGHFNGLKTTLLFALMWAIIMLIWWATGGSRQTLSIYIVMGLITTFGTYWFSDKLAIASMGAREVSEQEAPEINVSFQNQARAFEGGFHEVSIKATAEAKVGDRILFLIEVTQAGLFSIENVPESDMDPLLGIGCPTLLFPYLREAVSDLSVRAGFAPLLLQPVNFEAIFLQQRMQQAQAQAESDAQTTH